MRFERLIVENTIDVVLVSVEIGILYTSDDSPKREDDRDQFEVKWGGVDKMHTSSVHNVPKTYLLKLCRFTYLRTHLTRKV